MTTRHNAEKRDKAMFKMYKQGVKQVDIAEHFGVKPSYVSLRIKKARKMLESNSRYTAEERLALDMRKVYLTSEVNHEKERCESIKDRIMDSDDPSEILFLISETIPYHAKNMWLHEGRHHMNISEIYEEALVTAIHRLLQVRGFEEGLDSIRRKIRYKLPEAE